MQDYTSPIKYVLYSHYSAYEQADFAAFQSGKRPEDLQGVRHLQDHFRGLKELLTTPGHQGSLVLFYSPGLEEFLVGIAKTDETLLADHESLRFAQAVAKCIRRNLKEAGLEDKVRFLISLDLRVILGRVNTIFAGKFRRYFIGGASGIRYDAPKVVEAILRLRLLGNGVPVLRLDHDVIFRGKANQGIGDLGLFKAVACTVRAYQLRLAQPTVSTFLFSASYNSRPLLNPTDELDSFEAWSQAFATRIYPALKADPDIIRNICSRPKDERDAEWNTYVKTHLDNSFARQFYGLTSNTAELKPDGVRGLTSIGAHPIFAVISGALLCLSEGAILDLPPFSNLRNNVMWIDDHLKYSLHRAMNHFTSGETLNLEAGLGDARLDDVSVTKLRPSISNLPSYIFESYLPTLLWGAVMDAWITSDPILKCRVSSLSEDEQKRWRDERIGQQEAPLPKALLEALRIGNFSDDAEDSLREELRRQAVRRIEEVRQLWSKLKDDEQETFASYWAEGKVRATFGEGCFQDCKDTLWEGIAPNRDIHDPIRTLDDLSTTMATKINQLCDDTITYVHWTLDWPRFVQIVRSVRQGEFTADLKSVRS